MMNAHNSARRAVKPSGKVSAKTARPNHFGDHLREWRQRRHLSQFDLAGDAEISARHLSFVETGRAAPSRDMVLRLAERLDVTEKEVTEMERRLAGGDLAFHHGGHSLQELVVPW